MLQQLQELGFLSVPHFPTHANDSVQKNPRICARRERNNKPGPSRNTHRFLDFFFFVPSGPTSQLQGDPALSWGERKNGRHCIIHPRHRKEAEAA